MNCLCYHREKIKEESNKKKYNDYWNRIKEVSTPKLDAKGNKLELSCSYILCENIVKSGNGKNVLLGNIHYTFCTDECWDNWLSSSPNLRHNAKLSPYRSPITNPNSPIYNDAFSNEKSILDIPPLFI